MAREDLLMYDPFFYFLDPDKLITLYAMPELRMRKTAECARASAKLSKHACKNLLAASLALASCMYVKGNNKYKALRRCFAASIASCAFATQKTARVRPL